MSTHPALFISHGAPDLPLRPSPAREFLVQLGQQLDRPRSILVISAHWNTAYPIVSAAPQPHTIHDFGGFPAELYQLRYAAPGAPQLAARVMERLEAAGFQTDISLDRGLDHGAWNPLLLMYPTADIPVTQLSIQPQLDPAHHWAIGKALASLRQEGVLVLASGSATHNLWELGRHATAGGTPAWVTEFSQWLAGAIAQGDVESLLRYRQTAPHAARNHPTDEHLLPLFVALGAGGSAAGTLLHTSYSYGILDMAAYAFGQSLNS